MNLSIRAFLAVTALSLLLPLAAAQAAPYKKQEPTARLDGVAVKLAGPAAFIRIDGQDRNLDDILLSTQSPSAAVLAIYAEPAAWRKFEKSDKSGGQAGLDCYAVVSTPAPMAGHTVKPDDFKKIKADLSRNMKNAVRIERRLDGELGSVSDHQVEKASGRIDAFTVLAEESWFITYRLESTLELKYKGQPKPKISRSATWASTLVMGGKIINLQLVADPDSRATDGLDQAAQSWLSDFAAANPGLRK